MAGETSAETLGDSLTTRYMPAGLTRWTPDSGETIAERLGAIVAAAMGYEPEDLPWEVPLIELGLDSLMAVRIKNRVEYDFDLPPIQLTAVRDANLYNVEKLIEYALEHRDEVEQLHEYQKSQTAEEIAGAAAVPRCWRARPRKRRQPPAAAAVGRADPAAAEHPSGPSAATAEPTVQAESGGRRGGAQPGGRRQGAQLRCAAA